MRISGRFDFDEYPPLPAGYPTADGRLLHFDPNGQAHFLYELVHLPNDSDDPFMNDGIECRLWIADAEGRLWSVCSQFTSEYLIEALAFANFENLRDYYVYDDAPADIQALFESSLVLQGVQFSSDDRWVRSLRIRRE